MAVKTYNPQEVSIIAGVIALSSWNQVVVEMDEDGWMFTSGTTGEATRTKNANLLGTFTITVPQTSADNDILTVLYENSSVLRYATNMQGKYLLIHGMLDDNVHFQHAVVLANMLIEHNKQFQFMLYPRQYHGIQERRFHLYTLITDFIFNNL